ncbi:MAG: zf-TFIIB domain-containing protein [Acidobacteria bacterium]|nr:zf-TFIIB domain-containing protein [Acidobacteriota bacterium]
MNCPVCNVPLTMTDRSGVEIDYCPKCRGVWLDRGELDKIIERSAASAPEVESRKFYKRDFDDDEYRHPHHRKRKSFLGEIFDFD